MKPISSVLFTGTLALTFGSIVSYADEVSWNEGIMCMSQSNAPCSTEAYEACDEWCHNTYHGTDDEGDCYHAIDFYRAQACK